MSSKIFKDSVPIDFPFSSSLLQFSSAIVKTSQFDSYDPSRKLSRRQQHVLPGFNLTQPRTTWEEDINKELSQSGLSVGLSMGEFS